MGQKDKIEKIYFKNNENFANIFNYYFFNGNKVIKENNLKNNDKELIIDNKNLSKMERDILKTALIKHDETNKQTYMLLDIENQTDINYTMPVRIMGYDYFTYNDQIRNIDNYNKDDKIKMRKERKLFPVITLVIYYGTKKWNGPRDLYSMIEIPNENLKQFIPNYHINLIEPYNMEDEDFNKLNYDNRAVFELLKYSNDKEKMNDLFMTKYHDLTILPARLINEVTNSGLKINEEEGIVDMCKAIDDMRKESEAKGMEAGKAEKLNENIKTMYKNGADENVIAKLLGLDIAFVKQVLNS